MRWSGPWRALISALIAGLVTTFPAAATGPSAVSGPPAVTMILAGQPAWIPADGVAVLELALEGPFDGFDVTVTAHRPVTSRSALTRALEGRGLGAAEGELSVEASALAVNAAGNRLLAVGAAGPESPPDPSRIVPGRTGIYPLDIQLHRPGESADVRFVTPLVVIAPGVVPVTLAWVWRLDATPGHLPDGEPHPDAVADLATGGRLARLVDGLGVAPVPLTLAPTPETIDAWVALADGPSEQDLRYEEALTRLRAAAAQPGHQVLPAPYVPLDLPLLLDNDLGPEIDRQFQRGREALAAGLAVEPAATTLLTGPLDGTSLARLRRYGVERLVMAPSALQPLEQRLTPGRPFSLGARGRPFRAAVTDPGLADLLTGTAPPALQASRFLAALSLVALEAPREQRGVVVVTSEDWDPPDALLQAVLSGLASHPAVRPETLDAYFATVDPEIREGRTLVRSLAPRRSGEEERKAPVDAGSVAGLRRRLASFTQMVGEGHPVALAVDRAVLTSQAEVLTGGREGSRPSPRAYLAGASDMMATVMARVRGPDRQRVTLTAQQASIPISLLNANPDPLRILVRLESEQLLFPEGAERVLTLPPQNTTERFEVETRAPGAFPLIITVSSPDGLLMVDRSQVTIRSTAVSGVGAALTVGAGLFLLIWWGNHLRRSRRRRRGPPVEVPSALHRLPPPG